MRSTRRGSAARFLQVGLLLGVRRLCREAFLRKSYPFLCRATGGFRPLMEPGTDRS